MGTNAKLNQILKKSKRIFQGEIKNPVYIPVVYGEFLKGKSILITGGAGGIGYAMALACLRNEAKVVLAGRNESKLIDAKEKLKQEIPSDEMCIETIVIDIQNVSDLDKKINEANKKLGNSQLNVLINNAGISAGRPIGKTSESDFDKTIATNLKGTYFLAQAFSNYLIDQNIKGNILNVSSVSGVRPAITPYMLSKWGTTGLTEGLAKKMIKYDIVVNGIAPGPTATEMLKLDGTDLMYEGSPAKRYVDSEEVANLAVFLISDMGRMIVGETVYITGGCGTLTLDDIKY